MGRASVPRTLSRLYPHHVLSRPQFGALRPGQARWREPPLERPLPKEQVPTPEQVPLPERPYWMTPEHSKFGRGSRWEERVLIKEQRGSEPWSRSTAGIPPSPKPLPHRSSGRELSAFTLPPLKRSSSPEDPESDKVTIDCLGLAEAWLKDTSRPSQPKKPGPRTAKAGPRLRRDTEAWSDPELGLKLRPVVGRGRVGL